jgi:hypothetical protein
MTDTPAKGRKPTHIAKMPREHGPWPEIGAAWAGTNGGFTAQIDAFPKDGRIVFVPVEK